LGLKPIEAMKVVLQKIFNLFNIISKILSINLNYVENYFCVELRGKSKKTLSSQVLSILGKNFQPELNEITQLLEMESAADCKLV
jgi:hypothetical protein